MKAFMFYIDDWISSKAVQMMDAHEERGYLRLLMAAASSEDCSLPDDDTRLSVYSLLGQQWHKPTRDKSKRSGNMTSGEKLRACFRHSPAGAQPGRLYNYRMYKEYENWLALSEKRAVAGRRGGLSRVENLEANSKQLLAGPSSKSEANGKHARRVGVIDSSPSGVLGGESEGSQPPLSPPAVASPPRMGSWQADELYEPFVTAYKQSGYASIDEDFADAWFFCWRALDWEQKIQRTESLTKKLSAGEYSDPTYIPKPRKFLETEWKRPLRPPKKSAMDRAWEQA